MKPELPRSNPSPIENVYILTRMVNKDIVSLLGHKIMILCQKMKFDPSSEEFASVWKNRFTIIALYPDNTFDIQSEDGCAIINVVNDSELFGFSFNYNPSSF